MSSTFELKSGAVIEDETYSAIMDKLVTLQPDNARDYTWDDIGTATLMADIFSDDLRYCPQNGKWYEWDNRWKKLGDNGTVSDRLQTLLNLLLTYCDEIGYGVTEDDDPETFEHVAKYRKYVSSIRKFTAIKNILEMVKTVSTLRLSLSDMDLNPYLLNTPRGAFDLRNGKRITAEELRVNNVTKKTSCGLPDFTNTPCERWLQFVDEIMGGDHEKAKFLQRALGYSILGVNREECMFIAYGSRTRNGKGTLFSTIGTVLGQDYADSAAPDLICEGKNGKSTDFNAAQPALAKLVGVRLVNMSESSKDVRLDAASMKTMTGRDVLVTRDLYESSFSFVPQFTLWLNTNHLPAVTDDTVFSSGRIHVIEFNEHFDASRQDRDLKEIFALPENRPTILKWLYDGCMEYIKDGLNPPESVMEATENYRKLHDRIGGFLEDCCSVGNDNKVLRGNLYAAYRQWCYRPENKYNPLGSTGFYNEIAGRGFPPKRQSDGWYITGLELTDTWRKAD